MSQLNSKLKGKVLQFDWQRATPSFKIGVQHKGKNIAQVQFGKDYKYYDLASLTKIIFTTSLYMKLVDEGEIGLQDSIQKTWGGYPYADTKLAQLLSHTAGMPAWRPFYQKLKLQKDFLQAKEKLRFDLLNIKRRSSRRALYSDIDFFFLRFHIESILEGSLLTAWKLLSKDLGLGKMHFCADNKSIYAKDLYAPTERCPWRKKVLRGEVHDDNTWTLGGVSTHAGLFGDLASVMKYASLVRDAYMLKKGSSLCSQKTMKTFAKRQSRQNHDDWATGFMMPSPDGSSSGKYFSKDSIGHTGFTGTSFWFDPKKDISIVILSNRVHPKRSNNLWKKLRPKLHDAVIECLQEEKRISV